MDANSETGLAANRTYKDTVFTLLFSNEDVIREVYGAITGKVYGPETEVKISTLKNMLCINRVNDLSFEIDGKQIVLIEHQSTINYSMPLRMLLYIAEMYNRGIDGENIYREKMHPLKRPIFIMFYIGEEELKGGDEHELRLSDMYLDPVPAGQESALELVVKVYNINKGRNPKLAERSPTLDGYETFIAKCREYEKTGISLREAITRAVVDCIDNNILKKFLETNKPEVINMLLTEWDINTALRVRGEEGRERGREEGREEGIMEGTERVARALLAKGMDKNEVAEVTGLTIDDILRL
jgi:predicted transposase/invertase (TIGR01784 family)